MTVPNSPEPEPIEYCYEEVWRGDTWHPRREACGKPIKRRGLCGIHARRLDREEARRAAEAERTSERDEARDLATELTSRLGVEFTVTPGSTALIALTVESARALAAANFGVGGSTEREGQG